MSTSGNLRPLWLSGYQPPLYAGNPAPLYKPIYNSYLDRWTAVSSRVEKSRSTTAQLYGIRRYRAQLTERSRHPIHELIKQLQARRVTQSQMQHLLMPIQAFYHEECRTFYTVSEHAFISLAHLLRGTVECPKMIGPDVIWSIVQQVLTGLHFLISQHLEHTDLKLENILVSSGGVVKIGAIHLIRSTTAAGWDTMTDAVIELAQVFIIRTKEMCLRRMHKSDFGLGCCDYSVMSSGLDSLRKKLDTAHSSSTESAVAKNRAMGEVVLGALHMDFIYKAKGSGLAGAAEYAFNKGFACLEPVSKPTDPGRRRTSSLRRHNQLRRKRAHRGVRGRRLYGGLEERFLNRHVPQTNIRHKGGKRLRTPSSASVL